MTHFEKILYEIETVKVIDKSIEYALYKPIDLSIYNEELIHLKLNSSTDFKNYIENFLTQNDAKVAFGGYNEKRQLYQRSTIFKDNLNEERNIHIGLDLWIEERTNVLAALDGKVHSFKYNEGLGNYGPTIILEHQENDFKFYTLYGHLSLESIQNLKIGQTFKKGEILAQLGNAEVNGDYAPHLHFQIIQDIENNFGDYPGVCAQNNLNFFLQNCPNPNILLKIV